MSDPRYPGDFGLYSTVNPIDVDGDDLPDVVLTYEGRPRIAPTIAEVLATSRAIAAMPRPPSAIRVHPSEWRRIRDVLGVRYLESLASLASLRVVVDDSVPPGRAEWGDMVDGQWRARERCSSGCSLWSGHQGEHR